MVVEHVMLLLLALLQAKHWYVDFVDQSLIEIKHKGTYGHWRGIMHSLKHSIGTMLCVGCVLGPFYWPLSVMLGVLDGVVHYHVDWIKMNCAARGYEDSGFWAHFGLDQMAHQLTYLFLAAIITL